MGLKEKLVPVRKKGTISKKVLDIYQHIIYNTLVFDMHAGVVQW